MTSNNTPSPLIASASSVYANTLLPYRGFDGNLVDVSDAWGASAATFPQWLMQEFGQLVYVNHMIIASRAINGSGPKDFTIEGSIDNTNFITLASYTNQSYQPESNKRFNCRSDVKVNAIRITLTASYGWTNSFIQNCKIYYSLTPYMTNLAMTDYTQTTPYGTYTVSAESCLTTNYPWKAFDHNDSSNNMWVYDSPNEPLPTFLQIEFDIPRPIKAITIHRDVRNNANAIRSFIIQGINQDNTYNDLVTIENIVWNISFAQYIITDTTLYYGYRLYITDVYPSRIHFAETVVHFAQFLIPAQPSIPADNFTYCNVARHTDADSFTTTSVINLTNPVVNTVWSVSTDYPLVLSRIGKTVCLNGMLSANTDDLITNDFIVNLPDGYFSTERIISIIVPVINIPPIDSQFLIASIWFDGTLRYRAPTFTGGSTINIMFSNTWIID
jgi:hypothetical protein